MTGFGGSPLPPPSSSGRAFGPLLCCAAALLALVGSFQPLFSTAYRFGSQVEFAFTVTSWNIRTDTGGSAFGSPDDATPLNGVPLTMAAVVLLLAAVLGLRTAPWAASPRIARVRGPMTAIGAAFLAGTVCTIGMQELGWVGGARTTERAAGDQGVSVDASVGVGFWMVVAAAAIAIAAALHSRRPAMPAGYREEPDTPVLGIPVVIRLPDEPPPDRPD